MKVCGKTAALRAAVFSLSEKSLMGGGASKRPPGPARVNQQGFPKKGSTQLHAFLKPGSNRAEVSVLFILQDA